MTVHHGRMAGRKVLVAGSGSGIGRATALVLAAEGAEVVCTDLDAPAAEGTAELVRGRGGAARPGVLDVTSEGDWQETLDRCEAEGILLDTLVNSAGIATGGTLEETTLDEWRRVLAVNLDGTFLGTRAALAHFRRHGIAGVVVNVSSVSGIRAHAGAGAYGVSKAAVCMLSEVAAKECLERGDGIRVNVVSPGGVRTPLWRSMDYFRVMTARAGSERKAFAALAQESGVPRFADPEEIARAILYLTSDASGYVTGTNLVVDGGYRL